MRKNAPLMPGGMGTAGILTDALLLDRFNSLLNINNLIGKVAS